MTPAAHDRRTSVKHLTEGRSHLRISSPDCEPLKREDFFGEPELDVHDLMRESDGKAMVTLLELDN
ncbi:helicase HerA-like domain-containing protein, partial [Amycolatopsis japonica]|uniref:helicase HerA-like domain-containing protein n=1 Tax=Amycolatopsis japonica TaxID=208439 RepID=UPI00332E29F3